MAGPIPTPRRSRRAALLLAAALFALLSACTGSEPTPPAVPTSESAASPSTPTSVSPSASPTRKPPPFTFHLAGVHPSPTGKLRHAKARRIARRAARRILVRFDTLYRMAFINPRSWQRGDYRVALSVFGGHTRPLARKHLRILTLGLDAGRRFERVTSSRGRLKVNVLIAPNTAPATASVHAVFQERAVPKQGRATIIVSDGHYFVRPTKHGWVIEAFEVRRHDHRPH